MNVENPNVPVRRPPSITKLKSSRFDCEIRFDWDDSGRIAIFEPKEKNDPEIDLLCSFFGGLVGLCLQEGIPIEKIKRCIESRLPPREDRRLGAAIGRDFVIKAGSESRPELPRSAPLPEIL